MKTVFQKQANRHDPENGIFGDCYRTCIAGLLGVDRDSVPHHVLTMDPELLNSEVQPKYDAWLAERGLQKLAIPVHGEGVDLDEILAFQNTRTPQPALAMLTGQSASGCNHVVIVGNGKIVHDPAINDSGITGPAGDGFYWLTWLIPLEDPTHD